LPSPSFDEPTILYDIPESAVVVEIEVLKADPGRLENGGALAVILKRHDETDHREIGKHGKNDKSGHDHAILIGEIVAWGISARNGTAIGKSINIFVSSSKPGENKLLADKHLCVESDKRRVCW
jgi:hypothetical protein